MQNIINQLLPNHLLPNHSFECDIVISDSLKEKTTELLYRNGLKNKKLLIVCDNHTHAALGHRVARELNVPALLLEEAPSANEYIVNHLLSYEWEALVAVGSGTINDICKYASHRRQTPYVIFPTAPSMNGYLSANASISVNGYKQSLSTHLPKAIFCDIEVLSTAPQRLIISGFGDLLCRTTAQADWLLSHLLWNTHYLTAPFELLLPYEQALLRAPEMLGIRDKTTIALLMKALLISGAGMVMAQGSYPASQGEHLIAHTMEMKHGHTVHQSFHGEQIGITTLVMADIQHHLIASPLRLPLVADSKTQIESYFGVNLRDDINAEYQQKQALYEIYERGDHFLKNKENSIRREIQKIMLPKELLQTALTKAGAPTRAEDIGWKQADFNAATDHAKFIRNRFTFLDLRPLS